MLRIKDVWVSFLSSGVRPAYSAVDQLRIKFFNASTLFTLISPIIFIFILLLNQKLLPIIFWMCIFYALMSGLVYKLNRCYYHTAASVLYVIYTFICISILYLLLGANTGIHFFLFCMSISPFVFYLGKQWIAYLIFGLYNFTFLLFEGWDYKSELQSSYSIKLEILILLGIIFSYMVIFFANLLHRSIQSIKARDQRYKQIFETDALGIMEIDLNSLQEWMNQLKLQGVKDLYAYSVQNPNFVQRAFQKMHIKHINSAMLYMMEAETEEDFLLKMGKVFTPQLEGVVFGEALSLFENKRKFESEFEVNTLKGNKRTLWVTVHFPLDDSLDSVFFSHIDITALKQIENALETSRTRYKSIFENNLLGIGLTNEQFQFVEFNPALSLMLGYAPEELLELPVRGVVSAVDYPEFMTKRQRLVEGEISWFSMEMECIAKSGGRVYTITHIRGTYDEDQRFVGAVATVQDVTEEHIQGLVIQQNLEELDLKNKELKRYIESNMQLENFAYIASHDLREPLLTTIGFTRQLKRIYQTQLDEKGKLIIDHILKSTHHMDEQIKSLLVYSQAHNNDQSIEVFDLNRLLSELSNDLKKSLVEKKALLKIEKMPKDLTANMGLIRQLFLNLVTNAIKFHRPDVAPIIEIGTQSQEDGWIFYVKDNGIGIKEEYYDRIFILFKRLHTRNVYEGYGMGLAICKKIIERHEGRIWVESTVGKGTTFFFFLPYVPVSNKNQNLVAHLNTRVG